MSEESSLVTLALPAGNSGGNVMGEGLQAKLGEELQARLEAELQGRLDAAVRQLAAQDQAVARRRAEVRRLKQALERLWALRECLEAYVADCCDAEGQADA
jgi:hypothetical protein